MKHLLITLAVLVALAVGTAAFTYRAAGDDELKTAVAQRDALEWLRLEFRLSPEQFEHIRALHTAYAEVCEDHCRRIQQATRAHRELQKTEDADPAALVASEQKVQALRLECETAIAAHVRACAGFMSPSEAERYLALVLPKIADFDHQAAPRVHVSSHQH